MDVASFQSGGNETSPRARDGAEVITVFGVSTPQSPPLPPAATPGCLRGVRASERERTTRTRVETKRKNFVTTSDELGPDVFATDPPESMDLGRWFRSEDAFSVHSMERYQQHLRNTRAAHRQQEGHASSLELIQSLHQLARMADQMQEQAAESPLWLYNGEERTFEMPPLTAPQASMRTSIPQPMSRSYTTQAHKQSPRNARLQSHQPPATAATLGPWTAPSQSESPPPPLSRGRPDAIAAPRALLSPRQWPPHTIADGFQPQNGSVDHLYDAGHDSSHREHFLHHLHLDHHHHHHPSSSSTPHIGLGLVLRTPRQASDQAPRVSRSPVARSMDRLISELKTKELSQDVSFKLFEGAGLQPPPRSSGCQWAAGTGGVCASVSASHGPAPVTLGALAPSHWQAGSGPAGGAGNLNSKPAGPGPLAGLRKGLALQRSQEEVALASRDPLLNASRDTDTEDGGGAGSLNRGLNAPQAVSSQWLFVPRGPGPQSRQANLKDSAHLSHDHRDRDRDRDHASLAWNGSLTSPRANFNLISGREAIRTAPAGRRIPVAGVANTPMQRSGRWSRGQLGGARGRSKRAGDSEGKVWDQSETGPGEQGKEGEEQGVEEEGAEGGGSLQALLDELRTSVAAAKEKEEALQAAMPPASQATSQPTPWSFSPAPAQYKAYIMKKASLSQGECKTEGQQSRSSPLTPWFRETPPGFKLPLAFKGKPRQASEASGETRPTRMKVKDSPRAFTSQGMQRAKGLGMNQPPTPSTGSHTIAVESRPISVPTAQQLEAPGRSPRRGPPSPMHGWN